MRANAVRFERGLFLLFLIVALIALIEVGGAQEEVGAPETGLEEADDIDEISDAEDAPDDESDTEEEISKLIDEAEEFEEDLETGAGLLPGNPLYDIFDGIIDSREEKVAEMRAMAARCGQGDQDACDAFDISFDRYRGHADEFEREVSPEERGEAERSSRAIRGVVIREIAKNVDPTKKDELIREIITKEKDIELAAEIAAQINDLCGKLVELGEFEKANEVCNLDKDEEGSPVWLRERREKWHGEISKDAGEFMDVLQACMDVSDDDILGNYEGCGCDKMPGTVQDLCGKIVKLEDACGAGEEDSCGESDVYIEEFMNLLPEDLRAVMEQRIENFEEDGFERNRPEECGDIDDFRECMLRMAEVHIKEAPPQCQNALREGIRNGEVNGPRDGERICREIMMKEFGASECVEGGLSPDECAKFMSGGFNRGPTGPGIGFDDCESFESSDEKLECYRQNTGRAEFAGDYYKQRTEFREGEDFNHEEFEKRFREENRDKYVGFSGKYYGEGDEKRKQHQEMIDRTIKECESQQKPWFCNGPPDKPCYCGEQYDYREYEERDFEEDGARFNYEARYGQPESGFQQGPPPGFSPPPEGFRTPPEETQQPPEPSPDNSGPGGGSEGSSNQESSSGESSTVTTGGVIWGRITGNAFLDYYWFR